MVLLIDNYDSFTYNLVQYVECHGFDVQVFTHDAITLEEILALNPSHIIISPGPNSPDEAGISLSVIERFYKTIPILGVCLGHQCIAQFFGGRITQAREVIHGKTSLISHHDSALFENIPSPFKATRYHSLTLAPDSVPECLYVDAWHEETIMAISHRHYPVYGVQFHPEAILTEYGDVLLRNFLK